MDKIPLEDSLFYTNRAYENIEAQNNLGIIQGSSKTSVNLSFRTSC